MYVYRCVFQEIFDFGSLRFTIVKVVCRLFIMLNRFLCTREGDGGFFGGLDTVNVREKRSVSVPGKNV